MRTFASLLFALFALGLCTLPASAQNSHKTHKVHKAAKAHKMPKKPKNEITKLEKARKTDPATKQVTVDPKKSPGKHADNLSKNVNHELNRESKDINRVFQGKKK